MRIAAADIDSGDIRQVNDNTVVPISSTASKTVESVYLFHAPPYIHQAQVRWDGGIVAQTDSGIPREWQTYRR